MIRKIIKHGESTLTVSIPHKWAKARNLKPGAEVSIEELGNRLFISTSEQKVSPNLSVDVSGMTEFMIGRLLTRSYQQGYDTIKIKGADRKNITFIREIMPEHLGFDLTEEGNSIHIQMISKGLTIDFDSALRQAFHKVLENARECLDGYDSSDKEKLQSINDKDVDVNKLTNFCKRAINKGMTDQFGAHSLYGILECLEEVGDDFKHLATHLSKSKQKNKIVEQRLAASVELAEISFRYFYKPDRQNIIKGFELVHKLSSTDDIGSKKINQEMLQSILFLETIAHHLYLILALSLDKLNDSKVMIS